MRWGNYLEREGFFRGYNQVYFSFLAEPIIRGIENPLFRDEPWDCATTLSATVADLSPTFSGCVGLGAIDSQSEQFGGKDRISLSTFSAPRAFPIILATALAGRSVSFINTFLTPAKLIQTRV